MCYNDLIRMCSLTQLVQCFTFLIFTFLLLPREVITSLKAWQCFQLSSRPPSAPTSPNSHCSLVRLLIVSNLKCFFFVISGQSRLSCLTGIVNVQHPSDSPHGSLLLQICISPTIAVLPPLPTDTDQVEPPLPFGQLLPSSSPRLVLISFLAASNLKPVFSPDLAHPPPGIQSLPATGSSFVCKSI